MVNNAHAFLLIFVACIDYENIYTMKISKFTVVGMKINCGRMMSC